MLRNRARGYTDAHNFGRSRAPAGPAFRYTPSASPFQRHHDGAGNEERDDRDELTDPDRPIQTDRRTPLGLAILYHPRPCGARANTEARAAVSGGVATSAAAAHDAGGGDDRDTVLLKGVAVHTADRDDVLRLADRV